jgi:molybdenum cofactor cytidylyltransferase
MAASLRTGISHLPPSAGGAFIFLGDMPRIPPAILSPLAEALAQGAPAASPVYDGQRGHPVLVSRALFPQLVNLRGGKGARAVLDGLGPALVLVQTTDPGVLFDVDEPSDLV